jgi:subtilisin family serine protease
VADVPYRLWSEQAPEPPPAARTIVAKLKPTTPEGRRAAFGTRFEAAVERNDAETDERESRLRRLMTNARIKTVKPVLPEDVIAPPPAPRRARGSGRAAAAKPVVDRSRGLVTIEVPHDEDPKQMARHLEGLDTEVEYAYVPRPRRMFAKKKPKQADPLFSRQWGHAAVHILEARKLASFVEATKVTVAVADSGIDEGHPDLTDVVGEYRTFLKNEGKRDYAGHGTHVAGIIAARLNNGIGVAGLCAARLLVLKVLPGRVEWDAAAYYRSLAYCLGRARVLNLSLGSESFDPGESDVIADLIEGGGVVVVAAMGNEYEQGNPVEYPAALAGVCAVGATDQADRRGEFSSTGKHISISAPGVSIVSTTPTYKYALGKSDYDTWDGTSMAAPHVAAAAALLIAEEPDLKPAQVIKKLQRSADKVPGMTKRPSTSFGWGRLNIEAALRS